MLQIRRILVPVDFSEHSRLALSHARELAASSDARLDLLHVIEEPTFPSFYELGAAVYGDTGGLQQEAKAALAKLVEEVDSPDLAFGFGCYVEQGHVAAEIVRFAGEQDVDLIVIASHGLTGLQHVLLGSVVEKVVRTSPCPVLVVKAFGKSLLAAT